MKSIINPISKDISKCLFTPLNYRGISPLCTISNVYSSILSAGINNYCDIRNIFVEEQTVLDRTVHALIIFSPLQQ